MKKWAALVAFCAACAIVPAHASAATSVVSPVVTAYHGATIVQQDDPTADVVGATLLLSAGRDRQTPAQNGLAALVAEAIVQSPVAAARSGARLSLADAIANQGGSIHYAVEGNDVRFYLEGTNSQYASSIVPLFVAALSQPDLTDENLNRARAELDRKIAENERIALTVGIEMLNRSFYQNSDAGLPEYGIPATLAAQSSADAHRFYAAYYRRGGEVLSSVGDLQTVPVAAFQSVVDSLPAGTSRPVAIKTTPLNGSSRQLVAHRDVEVPWLVAQYPAPAVGSADFGPMLVLASFINRTLADIAEAPSVATRPFAERGVGSLYNFDSQPANIVVYVDGGLGDPSRTFATALAVVNILGQTKIQGDIGGMKGYAAGEFANGAVTLEDRSWLAAVFARANPSADYLNASIAAIARTTPADVQRVAKKYLASPIVALVLPRNAPAPTS